MTLWCRWHEIRFTLHQARLVVLVAVWGTLGCSTSMLVTQLGMAAVVPDAPSLPPLPAFHLN
jgi:hypothetical protein